MSPCLFIGCLFSFYLLTLLNKFSNISVLIRGGITELPDVIRFFKISSKLVQENNIFTCLLGHEVTLLCRGQDLYCLGPQFPSQRKMTLLLQG